MPSLGRSFLLFEGLAAAAAILVAAGLQMETPALSAVLSFAIVMTLLSVFDVWLPHGDSIDIAAPLAVGAMLVMGPVPAMGVAVASRLAAHVFRYRLERSDQLLHLLARRVISLATGALVWLELVETPLGTEWPLVSYVLAGAVAVLVDAVLLQAYAASRQRQSMGRLFMGSLRLQGLMWGAYVSVSALTAVLFPEMHVWGLLLMMGLLVVMRQSFAYLLDIRQAYRSTMEALAAALEAHDPRRQGHAERVADLARAIGMELGMHGRELERLGYAALLHDVDLIGSEPGDPATPPSRASEVLAGVGFLKDVVPVLAVCDGLGALAAPADRTLAYVVCRASNVDELITHERAAVRVYDHGHLEAILAVEERERVERAVWRLLTPGAREEA